MKAINFIILMVLFSCATNKTHVDQGTDKLGPDFQRCFIQSQSAMQGQSGGIDLQFVILQTGRTKDVKIVKSDFTEKNFHACLVGIIQNASFDPVTRETIFSQHLNFTAGQ